MSIYYCNLSSTSMRLRDNLDGQRLCPIFLLMWLLAVLAYASWCGIAKVTYLHKKDTSPIDGVMTMIRWSVEIQWFRPLLSFVCCAVKRFDLYSYRNRTCIRVLDSASPSGPQCLPKTTDSIWINCINIYRHVLYLGPMERQNECHGRLTTFLPAIIVFATCLGILSN